MILAWTLLRNSLPLQLIALALIGWVSLLANNAYQRHVGSAALSAKIEKKANSDAQIADSVRTDSDAGRGRVRSPYERSGH